ncbi:MAG: triose-phosphate isomerase [Phycisphaerae bacterium]|nr:triose-phosphate isomerase [Phycisphaerae bacterium]
MGRKMFIAGNWKMNTNRKMACTLANGVLDKLDSVLNGAADKVEVAFCPPFVYLVDVAGLLPEGKAVYLGSQNVYFEDNGAFTGEMSTAMLKDVGCTLVLAGHSERRHVIGESDELINKKVRKSLADGLRVILCIGETLAERKANKTLDVNRRQVKAGLAGVTREQLANVVIAYEPVWAIGTGVTASPAQAQEVHAQVRSLVAGLYDTAAGDAMQIQYGGSVKPDNALELLGQPDIDGALVGGASLKVDDFLAIIAAGAKAAASKK